MTSSVEYCGVIYDENTDWRSFLKTALHGAVYKGLEMDRHFGLSMPDALGALSEALRSTPMEIGLADAALEVVEVGNEEERQTVVSAGWEKAPNAFERMLARLERNPRDLSALWTFKLYGAMFRLRPTDPRLLGMFTIDVHKARRNDLADLLSLVARYNIDWMIEHLSAVNPPVSPDMWQWVDDAGMGEMPVHKNEIHILEKNRARLLTVIAKLGVPYIKALVEQVKSPPIIESLFHAVKSHPDFSAWM